MIGCPVKGWRLPVRSEGRRKLGEHEWSLGSPQIGLAGVVEADRHDLPGTDRRQRFNRFCEGHGILCNLVKLLKVEPDKCGEILAGTILENAPSVVTLDVGMDRSPLHHRTKSHPSPPSWIALGQSKLVRPTYTVYSVPGMQESIVDQAAEAIREYVIAQQLTAGQRLPSERDLAEALGTSRPALREAVRRLTAEQVVEVRGRSGIYIASVDLEHVFAVRLQLEPLAARLAAERRSAAELRELQALVAELRKAFPDPARFVDADRRLHAAIAQISGNDVLAGFILQLNDLALISRGVTAKADDTRQGTASDMAQIVAAIRVRNPGAAGASMSSHLERIQGAANTREIVSGLPVLDARRRVPGDRTDGARLV